MIYIEHRSHGFIYIRNANLDCFSTFELQIIIMEGKKPAENCMNHIRIEKHSNLEWHSTELTKNSKFFSKRLARANFSNHIFQIAMQMNWFYLLLKLFNPCMREKWLFAWSNLMQMAVYNQLIALYVLWILDVKHEHRFFPAGHLPMINFEFQSILPKYIAIKMAS